MRLISIDVGMNNFVTITNNIGDEPIIIKGKALKARNQWYNKCIKEIKADKKADFNIRISRTASSSIAYIIDYFSEVSDWIIGYCISNNIDTVIIGQYKILEKKDFVSIPFEHFYSLLETKCKYYNIRYKVINEKYTSGTSFFDDEPPIKAYYNKQRRVYKHLWQCNNGDFVNADVNDSYQIMRKAYPELFKNGIVGFKKEPRVIKMNKECRVENRTF
ncbi:MAG: transposase [Clostridia bacterium]|jgi:putative transposase|nr:transposase [Clostridia bacterium]